MVKPSPFLYLNRIHTVTFLPFRTYNADNQLIIDANLKKIPSNVIKQGNERL